MKLTTILYAVVGSIAFLCGSAFADGVPLITAGPAIPANSPLLTSDMTKEPDFVKLHPIAFSRTAFGANVLTVTIKGVEHRFVGQVQLRPKPQTRPPVVVSNVAGVQSPPPPPPPAEITTWIGTEGTGRNRAVLVISRDDLAGTVSAVLDMPNGHRFETKGNGILLERDGALSPMPRPMAAPQLPTLPAFSGARP